MKKVKIVYYQAPGHQMLLGDDAGMETAVQEAVDSLETLGHEINSISTAMFQDAYVATILYTPQIRATEGDTAKFLAS